MTTSANGLMCPSPKRWRCCRFHGCVPACQTKRARFPSLCGFDGLRSITDDCMPRKAVVPALLTYVVQLVCGVLYPSTDKCPTSWQSVSGWGMTTPCNIGTVVWGGSAQHEMNILSPPMQNSVDRRLFVCAFSCVHGQFSVRCGIHKLSVQECGRACGWRSLCSSVTKAHQSTSS